MVARGGFEYRGDHLICPQGKALRRGAFHNRDRIFQYVARHKDCRACVTVQSWEGELAEVGLGMASGGSGGYVIYLEWMGKSTSALPTGIC